MSTTSDLAARILITYEATLEGNGKDTLATRLEAMQRTVETLNLREMPLIPVRPAEAANS